MKKLFIFFFIVRLAVFPRFAIAGEVLTPPTPARAGLALEIVGLNLIFFSTLYIAWQSLFKKNKYLFNTNSGECWILWQGRAVKLRECPPEVLKQINQTRRAK